MEDENQAENCIGSDAPDHRGKTNMEQHAMIARMDEVLEKAWTLDRRKISSVAYGPVSSGYSGL